MFVLVMNEKSREPELLMAAPESDMLREWLKKEILDKDHDWIFATQDEMWYHRKTLQTIRIQQCPMVN